MLNVFGIDIDLHWTFLVLLALMFLTGGFESLLLAFILFGSVVLHELSHSLVARMHKIDVKRIILLPIGGMSVIEEFSMPSEVELKVAIAGPALSLCLAILSYAVELLSPFPALTALAAMSKEANAILCVFNLLPAIPMDGGRVWRALRQRTKSYLSATREAVTLSKFVVVTLLMIGFVLALFTGAWGFFFWNLVLGLFIFVGSGMELGAALFKTASEGIRVRDAMHKRIISANGEETLQEAFALAYSGKVRNLLLITGKRFGVVPLAAFVHVPRADWAKTKIKSLSSVPISCSPADDALGVWKKMRASHIELAPVIEKGKLVGVVTETDIERLIYLKKLSITA